MKTLRYLLLLACLTLCLATVKPASAVIYEFDNRLDIYEVDPASPVRVVADSVAAVVETNELTWQLSGRFFPDQLRTLRERKRVCPDVRYSNQPTMGFCSSFLIAPDLVVMARHCLNAAPCSRMHFAFDYAITESGDLNFSASEVYRCKDFSYPRNEDGPTYDFVVVELDRPVTGRGPLPLRSAPSPSHNAKLYALGHPNGLPQKLAPGGVVMEDRGSYFLTQIDTFHGNSGSPVLNAETHEVEGVLIDGEMDYESRGGCRVPKICQGDECTGEKVLNISHVLEFLGT